MSVIYVPSTRVSASAPIVRRMALPSLSLLITSLGDRTVLERGLAVALPAAVRDGVEVLVSRPGTPGQLSELARDFAGVRFVMASPGMSPEELLMLGMAEASGHVVAFLEDAALAGTNLEELFACRQGRWVPRASNGAEWMASLRAAGVAPPMGG